MIFIDESFKDIYVMGAVVGSRHEVEETVRITKAFITKHNKSGKKKINLPEIKDNIIHRKFPVIKQMVLNNLTKIKSMKGKQRTGIKIYAVYFLEEQTTKLSSKDIYKMLTIGLLEKVLASYDEEEITVCFDVYFDHYGEKLFREQLYKEIKSNFPNKKINLTHVSSEQDKAIQTADVVTGTIRRYLIGEDRDSLEVFRHLLHVIEPIKTK